jgi:hypothetical protein
VVEVSISDMTSKKVFDAGFGGYDFAFNTEMLRRAASFWPSTKIGVPLFDSAISLAIGFQFFLGGRRV